LGLFANNCYGQSLQTFVDCETYALDKEKIPYLDVSSAYDKEKNEVIINVVNRHKDKAIVTDIISQTGIFNGTAKVFEVNGKDIKDENSGNQQLVKTSSKELPVKGEKLNYSFPAHSFTLIRLPITINANKKTYKNPVVNLSLPDPTILKAEDGYFYLYATEDIAYTPVFQSKDLVNWKQVGAAFTKETRPSWEPKGGVWAPDINYINGKYVLYYSMSTWGGVETCGIGVAVSDRPEGPFTDKGPLFRSNTIGVRNSIDQFYIEDGGKKYLVWGSFNGIYCIELEDDGLALKNGAEKVRIAGTVMEGSYIHKRGKYYYLFGSTGTCCEGANSTYTTVVGRSENLFGPYLTKKGESMMDNHYEEVIRGNTTFAGTGHNAEIMTDDEGNDWILYHAYPRNDPGKGRVLLLDRVLWVNDWPAVAGSTASLEADVPVFKAK
jgi:arabinan endo-1,5-alpha-L-arabinosidase